MNRFLNWLSSFFKKKPVKVIARNIKVNDWILHPNTNKEKALVIQVSQFNFSCKNELIETTVLQCKNYTAVHVHSDFVLFKIL